MKKSSFVFMIVFIVAVLAACGAGTSGADSGSNSGTIDADQKECIESIQTGLQERWGITDKETASFEEYRTLCAEQGIPAELNAVKGYIDFDFKDEEFKTLINDYAAALEKEIEGIQYYAVDTKNYNEIYVPARKARMDCLNKLKDDYGLTVDDKWKNSFKGALNRSASQAVDAGESVVVSCDYGDVEITIEGIDTNNLWTGYAKEYYIADNQMVGLLKFSAKNISYEDPFNKGFVSFDNLMELNDPAGYTIIPLSVAWEYGGYDAISGAFGELSIGQKKKIASGYAMDENTKEIAVYLGKDYICFLNW